MSGINIGMYRVSGNSLDFAKIVSVFFVFFKIFQAQFLHPNDLGQFCMLMRHFALQLPPSPPPHPHLCWFSVAAATVAVVRAVAVVVFVLLLIANLLGKTGSIWSSTVSCSAMCVAPKMPVENTFQWCPPAPVPPTPLSTIQLPIELCRRGGGGQAARSRIGSMSLDDFYNF